MRDLDKYTKDYVENYSLESYMIKIRRKKVLEEIAVHNPITILEIGCGIEPLFEYVENYKVYDIIEPIELFCDIARDKASNFALFNKSVDITIYKGIPQTINNNKKYSFVVISSLLHELEEPSSFLNEIKKFCNSETVIHINVANANSIHNQLAVKMGLISNIYDKSVLAQKMQRHSTFDIQQLKKFAEDNGFEVIDSGGYFLKVFTHNQLNLMIGNRIIDDKVLDGLYNLGKEQAEQSAEIYVNIKLKL